MVKNVIKNEAQELRKVGKSISEISDILGISKSTASIWCREIKISNDIKRLLYKKMIAAGHKGRLAGAYKNKLKREENIKNCKIWAREHLSTFDHRDFLITGLGLYWGEGSKKIEYNLSFVNSDSSMVKFMYHWFKHFFILKEHDFIFRVYINQIHKERNANIIKYWSNMLGIDQSLFKKTVFTKVQAKKAYNNNNEYYGMLSLRIKRSSLIKYKILALIDILRNADVAQVARASHS